MADTKITALTALTAADPANDVIPIVDVSDTSMAASGTTKKISVNNILGASGTATLASATITGAATVGTTLGVTGASTLASVGVTGAATVGTTLGVTGVSTFAAGTALLPALTTTGDTNTGIYYPAADTFAVTTGGTERYRVDSTGLGIGASPSYKLDLVSTGYCESRIRSSGNGQQISLRLETKNSDTTDCKILLGCGVTGNNQFLIQDTANTKNLYLINGVGNSTNAHLWYSGTATATMTLTAAGDLLITKTSVSGTTLGCELTATGVISGASANLDNLNIYNTTAALYRFYVSGAGTVFATNTAISNISDARLKENVQDIDVGLAAILSLKPRKFDWKAGKGKDIKGDRGFIAQEFETVFPNLVDEWKDPAPEGEAPYKSVRQDLIPVLVKAIQELTARVQTLEAR